MLKHFVFIICLAMLMTIETIDVKHGGLKQDHGEWAKAFMCMS